MIRLYFQIFCPFGPLSIGLTPGELRSHSSFFMCWFHVRWATPRPPWSSDFRHCRNGGRAANLDLWPGCNQSWLLQQAWSALTKLATNFHTLLGSHSALSKPNFPLFGYDNRVFVENKKVSRLSWPTLCTFTSSKYPKGSESVLTTKL